MIVILDNGHGSDTPGKRSPVWGDGSQLFEYEFNRDIVKRIKLEIPQVLVLVPELTDVSLPVRVSRVNQISKREQGNVLLISIHANAGGGTGWEVWTSVGKTLSDTYAEEMFACMANALKGTPYPLRVDKSDGDSDKESQFYILKNTICPAILTENLFMDTYNDCKYIMSKEGRQTIADAHIEFIRRVLK